MLEWIHNLADDHSQLGDLTGAESIQAVMQEHDSHLNSCLAHNLAAGQQQPGSKLCCHIALESYN